MISNNTQPPAQKSTRMTCGGRFKPTCRCWRRKCWRCLRTRKSSRSKPQRNRPSRVQPRWSLPSRRTRPSRRCRWTPTRPPRKRHDRAARWPLGRTIPISCSNGSKVTTTVAISAIQMPPLSPFNPPHQTTHSRFHLSMIRAHLLKGSCSDQNDTHSKYVSSCPKEKSHCSRFNTHGKHNRTKH